MKLQLPILQYNFLYLNKQTSFFDNVTKVTFSETYFFAEAGDKYLTADKYYDKSKYNFSDYAFNETDFYGVINGKVYRYTQSGETKNAPSDESL